MNEQMMKDIHNWEREYSSMPVDLNKREQEILKGSPIKKLLSRTIIPS